MGQKRKIEQQLKLERGQKMEREREFELKRGLKMEQLRSGRERDGNRTCTEWNGTGTVRERKNYS